MESVLRRPSIIYPLKWFMICSILSKIGCHSYSPILTWIVPIDILKSKGQVRINITHIYALWTFKSLDYNMKNKMIKRTKMTHMSLSRHIIYNNFWIEATKRGRWRPYNDITRVMLNGHSLCLQEVRTGRRICINKILAHSQQSFKLVSQIETKRSK